MCEVAIATRMQTVGRAYDAFKEAATPHSNHTQVALVLRFKITIIAFQ